MLHLFMHVYLHVRVHTCAPIDHHYLFAERDRSVLAGCVRLTKANIGVFTSGYKNAARQTKEMVAYVCVCVYNEIDSWTRFMGMISYKMFLSFLFFYFYRSILSAAEYLRIILLF